jgi:hypothetical protein
VPRHRQLLDPQQRRVGDRVARVLGRTARSRLAAAR